MSVLARTTGMAAGHATHLGAAYLRACELDVTAFKPGNVSVAAPGHDMDAEDFLRSARVTSPLLCDPSAGFGERLLGAVKATREAVGCNTNLGILLLCAPPAQLITQGVPAAELAQALGPFLRDLGARDTRQVFEAIRLAAPGGLGRVERHDVQGPAPAGLHEAMCAAARRDLIAAQYANGYRDLFDLALPYWQAARSRWPEAGQAVTELYLFLLSRFEDSHVRRRHGDDEARRVSAAARDLLRLWRQGGDPDQAREALISTDRRWKLAGINPGTTADLVVACLFIDHLQRHEDEWYAAAGDVLPRTFEEEEGPTGVRVFNPTS